MVRCYSDSGECGNSFLGIGITVRGGACFLFSRSVMITDNGRRGGPVCDFCAAAGQEYQTGGVWTLCGPRIALCRLMRLGTQARLTQL